MKEAYAVKRTVPPSAEIEEQIDRLLAVGVGENPRESLSELAKLGARLIIQRAVEDEFDAWLGRARYELPARLPARAAQLRERAAQRVSPPQAADRGGRARAGDPADPGGCRDVRLQAVPAGYQVGADRAFEGAGDRRVRAWPVDARRGVAVREGRARETLEVDRLQSVRGAARTLRGVQAPRPLRHQPRGVVSRRDLHLRSSERAQGGRAGRLGIHRRRRAHPAFGGVGDARVARGLARAGA